jgi:hypothetical protein
MLTTRRWYTLQLPAYKLNSDLAPNRGCLKFNRRFESPTVY